MQKPNLESSGRNVLNSAFSRARSGASSNPNVGGIVLYALGSLLAFGLVGLGAAFTPWSFAATYLLVQAAALGLGVAHLYSLERFMAWYNPESLGQGVAMTLLAWGAGLLGLGLLVWLPWLPAAGARPLALLPATLPFLAPFCCREAFEAWVRVPEREYKRWAFRLNYGGPDYSRVDLNHFMVVHFWMPRRFGERLYYDFSSKAPYEMTFGDLFQLFLTDYNVSKPEQALQYLDEAGRPYEWLFYAKRPWWKSRHYYNPDYTFRDNFIRQGDIIVAQRLPA